MKWIEVKVVTTPSGAEPVSAIMLDIGVGGLFIEDPRDITEWKSKPTDWDYIGEELQNIDKNKVTIRAYLSQNDNYVEKIALLREKLKVLENELHIENLQVEVNDIYEEDWANNWKKYYKPVRIGKKIVIKPTWEDYEAGEKDDVIVELDPGMAFGTGTHETTVMCSEFIETFSFNGMKVLDVGCGSGILGIIALKLGAQSCLSVDIEANAVKVTNENAKLNNVTDKMRIVQGDLLEVVKGSFDIITANIIADAIIFLADIIESYLSENGVFIASGIIRDRYLEVKEALLKNKFKIIEEKFMGEWVALAVSR